MRSHPRAPLSVALVGLALFAVSTGALTATAATVEPDAPVVVETVEPDAPVVVETAEPDAAMIEAAAETGGPSISATQAPLDAPMIITPVNPTFIVASGFPVSVATEVSLGQINVEDQQFVTMLLEGEDVDPVVCLSVALDHTISEYSCSFDVPGPGRYQLTAIAVETLDPEYEAVSEPIALIVGTDAPAVFTNYVGYFNTWTTGSPTLTGSGPAFGSVSVEVTYNDVEFVEQTAVYCTIPEVPSSGFWSCEGSPVPWGYNGLFTASALDVLSNPTVPPLVDEIGGDFLPLPPSADYVFGPSSIEVTLQGMPDWNVFADIISVVDSGEGYDWEMSYEYCPLFSPNPLPGGESETCFYGDLEPGIWWVSAMQEAGFVTGLYRDDYIMIPDAPTGLSATVNPDRSVTFAGVGSETGYTVVVRGPGDNNVCSGVVAEGGAWQCTASAPAGTASYRATQQATGFVAAPGNESGAVSSYAGYSAYTAPVSVTVPPAPSPPPAPQQPIVTPSPVPWVLEGYDGSPLTPGQQLSLTATGLPVGTTVVVEIRSTPRVLGTTVVGDTGAFALEVTVPLDLEPGDHTLVALATPPGGVESPVAIPVVVVAVPVPDLAKETIEPISEDKSVDSAEGSGGSNGSGIDRSDPTAPSAISDSIPTIERIFTAPLTILVSGGLALLILLLVAFPAELLNSTLASNTRRLGRWYATVENGVDRATEWFASVTRTRALAAAVLVVLTSLIFGFVDPNYGFDPVSVRMTISLAIGLFIVTYVSSWISGAIIRRVWNIETRVGLQPAALVFAVIGVIVARVLEFSPGFLIGLVIGLDILTRVGAPHRVRAILTNIAVIVGLAVLAWAGFSIMTAVMTGEPSFGGLLVSDALVATTAEGLTAALAALLPLGFLDGHEVFRRSKLLWAGSFAFVATVFSLIVLPTAAGETEDVADVGFWILIMVIFAVVTLTLWALLHFTGGSDSDDDELVEQPAVAAR